MNIHRHFLLLLCLVLMSCMTAWAQKIESFDSPIPEGYKYWFYSPEADTTAVSGDSVVKKPLVVFLHGQSICGRDINRVLRYGTIDALRRGRKLDAYVVAPLNPGGRWVPRKVMELVDWATANYDVDSCRVYVLGMSLGGYGTIDCAAAYPDRFAAAMALCGGGTTKNFAGLCEIPLWILHGTADRAVRIRESDAVVQGMHKACADPQRLIYTRMKGLNHGALARAFYLPQTYDWLFAHSLRDSARVLCRDYDISNASFTKAYVGLHSPSWNGMTLVQHTKANTPRTKDLAAVEEDDGQASFYRVRSGDTLSVIAKRHHTSVKHICALNGITSSTTLRVGRRLRVK